MGAPTAASAERRRCIQIVQEYRRELTRSYAVKPDAPNAGSVLKLIQRLQEMETKMAMGRLADRTQLSAKIKPEVGGFSIEEMELAQNLIAEQERNPFEG